MILQTEKVEEYVRGLHKLFNSLQRYRKPFDLTNIPVNGFCIIFENNQKCFDGEFDRIVNVGFHYNNGKNRKRIFQFFRTTGRDATLKRHVGLALANQANENEEFLNLWEMPPHKKEGKNTDYYEKEKNYNKLVHEYIYNNMSFVVVPYVNSNKNERKLLKDKILYTLAMYNKDKTYRSWLGNESPNVIVRTYGLWAEDYLKTGQVLTEDDFNLLKNLMER